MKELQTAAKKRHAKHRNLAIKFACTQSKSLDIHHLRYHIFARELGANLPSRPRDRS